MDVHGPECKGKFILQIGCCIKKVLFCFRIAVLSFFVFLGLDCNCVFN